LFYAYDDNKTQAATRLYEGIKAHLKEYGEDRKEHEFDEHPDIEVNQMYKSMEEAEEEPTGGYEV